MVVINSHPRRKNRRLFIWLAAAAVSMFFFGYAMVPLYNVMCSALGINGKPSMKAQGPAAYIDRSRMISMEFVTSTNANLPWIFKPLTTKMEIHPGEDAQISFYAKNDSDHTMTVQAIPSIAPGLAAKYLKKTECFCFTQQTLASHQAMKMDVIFHLDPALPKEINTVTLSYTLFAAKNK